MFSERVQTQKRTSSLSLSCVCVLWGGKAKQVDSHGSDFEKLDLVIHLFLFATKGRAEDLERSTKEGEIRGFRK